MRLNIFFSKSIFLVLIAVSSIGCNTSKPEAEVVSEDDTVTQTKENTKDLLGLTVTIRSNALQQIEPATFSVAEREFFNEENIVVVNVSGKTFELPTDAETEVQVTGEVTKFILSNIESAYDLELDPDLYVEYTNRPAIIAESLAIAPEPGTITSAPSQYYGRVLAVTGEVKDIYDNNIFSLNEDELFGANDLLVLVTDPVDAVEKNETIAVTGKLRAFVVSDLEKDYDLAWDLDVRQEIEAEYTDKPVLIVDRVYSSAIPGVAK